MKLSKKILGMFGISIGAIAFALGLSINTNDKNEIKSYINNYSPIRLSSTTDEGEQNESGVESQSETTSYHLIESSIYLKTYSEVLCPGYYIAVNQNNTFSKSMFLGDVTSYNDYMSIARVLTDYTAKINVDSEDLESVQLMLSEFDEYYGLTENNTSWITNVSMFKVNSYGVFDPNTSSDLQSFDLFYVPTDVNTNNTIAGGMTHLVDVSNPLSLDQIKARYTATDDLDGDLTDQIEFVSDYDENNLTLGKNYILASVTDSNNITTYAADTILVRDIDNPITSLTQSKIEIEVGTELTSAQAKEYFVFEDNYSSGDNLKKQFIDNYNSSYNIVGEYTIQAKCEDEQGNYSNISTLTIVVKDTVAPTIALKDGTEKIISMKVLTDAEILDLFVVTDNYCSREDILFEVHENSCNGTTGVYSITMIAEDLYGNSAEYTVVYEVYLTGPVINVSNVFYITAGEELSNEEFIELLTGIAAQTLNVPEDEIELSGEFDLTTPGTYTVKMSAKNGSTYNMSVVVEEDTTEEVEDNTNWFEDTFNQLKEKFDNEPAFASVITSLSVILLCFILIGLVKFVKWACKRR